MAVLAHINITPGLRPPLPSTRLADEPNVLRKARRLPTRRGVQHHEEMTRAPCEDAYLVRVALVAVEAGQPEALP